MQQQTEGHAQPSYISFEPNINDLPFCVKYPHTILDVGAFICFNNTDGEAAYGAFRVSKHASLFMNVFVTCATIPKVRNCYKRNTVELIQSQEVVNRNKTYIGKLIFVFKLDNLANGKYWCKGMKNTFFTRFQVAADSTKCQIPSSMCLPFPCCYMKPENIYVSYPRRVP